MIVAAICARCMTYRYRTDDLPDGVAPLPNDYAPIAPQVTPAVEGQKATCDTCASDLKFVRGADWATLTAQVSGSRNGTGPTPHPRRTSVAPAAISELFRVEPGEDVKDMRVIAGDRILVVTSRRIVVVDPHLIGQEASE